MAQVTLPYTLTAGTPENVNNLMSNLTALRDGVNTIDTAQIANGAVTDAKLATALADNLGITNGGNTRRTSGSWATERTVAGDLVNLLSNTAWTDVTGASFTISIPSSSIVCVGFSADIRSSDSAALTQARALIGSAGTGEQTMTNTGGYMTLRHSVQSSSYVTVQGGSVLTSNNTGTGTITCKAQFRASNFYGPAFTAYIKNVYMYAVVLNV